MDDYNQNYREPWQQGVYETGRTRPPKNHGCLIAFLLVAVIFLTGAVSVLGILNVRLRSQLKDASATEQVAFHVQNTPEAASSPTEKTTPTESAPHPTEEPMQLESTPVSAENVPQEGGLSLQEIYESSIHSVVSIACTLPNGSSTGTGVVLTRDGYIVTNAHVVEDASLITIYLTDGRTFEADLIGADSISDLAVLYVKATDLAPAQFGNSDALRVGDSVVAIGDPLGLELRGSMTDGIISAINRDMVLEGRTMTLIQTNAALNSGNSGGPLINCYGQVIGINTLKISAFVDDAGVEGLGFAIPSTTVKEIVDQLIDQGYVSGRPTLGITGEPVSSFYQRYYRMPAGLYITDVAGGGPAHQVGIQEGDILIKVGGKRIASVEDLNTVLYAHEVGDSVNVVIYRGGVQYEADLTLAENKGN